MIHDPQLSIECPSILNQPAEATSTSSGQVSLCMCQERSDWTAGVSFVAPCVRPLSGLLLPHLDAAWHTFSWLGSTELDLICSIAKHFKLARCQARVTTAVSLEFPNLFICAHKVESSQANCQNDLYFNLDGGWIISLRIRIARVSLTIARSCPIQFLLPLLNGIQADG